MSESLATAEVLARAERMGAEYGRRAASWFFDGNTTTETYAAILRGLDEGDPAVMDLLPSSPLSGEWADDPSPTSLLVELFGEGWDAVDMDDEDEICRAYEDGFYSASVSAIEETARRMLS